MKKILFLSFLVVSLGYFNQSHAQCNGASVTINNFTISPTQTSVSYSFNWTFVQGNASIQVRFLCNNVVVATHPCIANLKSIADGPAGPGPHIVTGSQAITCNGVLKVEIVIWTNNSCGGNDCVASFREVQQTTLPVSFKSFSANRNNSNVAVKWVTATEQNNSGFAVERNVNGTWDQIAFVPSQAAGGNSDALLSYSYNDLNSNKGVSQYRIKQIDIDAQFKYSEVRSVRGDGQTGKIIVYPNPSSDGKVNVVFEDAKETREVSVIDMSGRIVKQFRNVTNNNISIENLTPGIYSLRVFVPATGEQAVQKIVVNK